MDISLDKRNVSRKKGRCDVNTSKDMENGSLPKVPSNWIASNSKKYKWLVPISYSHTLKTQRKSVVWEYFDLFERRRTTDVSEDAKKVVRCRFSKCHRELSFETSSTTGMRCHLLSAHREETRAAFTDLQDEQDETKCRKNGSEPMSLDRAILHLLDGVVEGLPYNLVENDEVKRQIVHSDSSLQPLTGDVIPGISLANETQQAADVSMSRIGLGETSSDEWNKPNKSSVDVAEDVLEVVKSGTSKVSPKVPSNWIASSSKKYKWLIPITAPQKSVVQKKSVVWEYFELFERRRTADEDEDGQKIVRCRFPNCHRELSYETSSTTGMRCHLLSTHREDTKAAFANSQDEQDEKENGRSVTDEIIPYKRGRIELYREDENRHVHSEISSARISVDEALLQLIVVEGLPFSIVESTKMKEFARQLDSSYELPNRSSVAENLFAKEVQRMNGIRERLFSRIGPVGISVGEWSTPSKDRNFIAIQAHGWSADFERLQIILGVIPSCELPRDGEVAESLHDLLAVCKIKNDSITCIASKEASVVKKAAKIMGLNWHHYLEHSINTVLKGVLMSESCQPLMSVLELMKNNATIIGQCSKLRHLNETQKRLGMDQLTLPMVSPTHWNSALALLRSSVHSAADVNDLVMRLIENDEECALSFLSEADLEIAEKAIDFLSLFEEITQLAANNEESVSSYLPAVRGLEACISARATDPLVSQLVVDMAEIALQQMNMHFFSSENNLKHLKLATFLDPRYIKRKEIFSAQEWALIKQEIENEALNIALMQRNGEKQSGMSVIDLMVHSAIKASVSSISPSTTSLLSYLATPSEAEPEEYEEDYEGATTLAAVVQKEIRDYLKLVAAFRSSTVQYSIKDVADFWRSNTVVLPYLSILARRYLGPTMSQVEVENLFSSVTNLLINGQGNAVSNEKLIELILLRDFFLKEDVYSIPESGSSVIINSDGELEVVKA